MIHFLRYSTSLFINPFTFVYTERFHEALTNTMTNIFALNLHRKISKTNFTRKKDFPCSLKSTGS